MFDEKLSDVIILFELEKTDFENSRLFVKELLDAIPPDFLTGVQATLFADEKCVAIMVSFDLNMINMNNDKPDEYAKFLEKTAKKYGVEKFVSLDILDQEKKREIVSEFRNNPSYIPTVSKIIIDGDFDRLKSKI